MDSKKRIDTLLAQLAAQVKKSGFASYEEYNILVERAPFETRADKTAFVEWLYHDGTKAGLLRLIGGEHPEAANG